LVINNKSKASVSKIEAVIIGRAIHPDLPLVGSLGIKLSKADNKAFTIVLAALSTKPVASLPASVAIWPALLPTSVAISPAFSPVPLATSPTLPAMSPGLISMPRFFYFSRLNLFRSWCFIKVMCHFFSAFIIDTIT